MLLLHYHYLLISKFTLFPIQSAPPLPFTILSTPCQCTMGEPSHLPVSLPVCSLSAILLLHLSVHLSRHLSIILLTFPSMCPYLFIYLSSYQLLYMSVYLSVHSSICIFLWFHPSGYPCINNSTMETRKVKASG